MCVHIYIIYKDCNMIVFLEKKPISDIKPFILRILQ